MHLSCLNNSMNECCMCCLNRCHCVMCYAILKMGEWKTIFPLHSESSLGAWESFGNLDILLCTETSRTENCAEHILSHQKTRNSVNTSTAGKCSEKQQMKNKTHFFSIFPLKTHLYLQKDKECCHAPSGSLHPAWLTRVLGAALAAERRDLFIMSPAQHC